MEHYYRFPALFCTSMAGNHTRYYSIYVLSMPIQKYDWKSLKQLRIVVRFRAIIELALHEHPDNIADLQAAQDEEAPDIWDQVRKIRERANEIQLLIGTATDAGDSEVQDLHHVREVVASVHEHTLKTRGGMCFQTMLVNAYSNAAMLFLLS